ncbi:hypothetical protein KAR34_07930 [bacterium]|nr:hypothetical protein [bacterium]
MEEMEKQFIDTLNSLKEKLDDLVIVGGWCPCIYSEYLWKKKLKIPSTLDIDFGVEETGVKNFETTVYDDLRKSGYMYERLYEEEEIPGEFYNKKGNTSIKIEFITSFYTSDDTLNKFLGRGLACNRIDAFEMLLENYVMVDIEGLKVKVADPATYMFHKGISFVMRGEELKKKKDLFCMYFK